MTAHQLSFISDVLGKQKEETATDLRRFGQEVKQHISTAGFHWQGVGNITADTKTLSLTPMALAPVRAEKVLRQDAEHSVLQGDKELTSTQITGSEKADVQQLNRAYPAVMIVGWIVLLLAILAIVFLLYTGKFKTGAAGSRLPVANVFVPFKHNFNL